jgi:hypothetical protein
MSSGFVIFDGEGYWVARRRGADKRPIDMWSTKKKDATPFHFYEVARSIAASIPQPVTIRAARR